MAASDAGLNPSRLFYVRDRLSGLWFLVDTGAEVRIPPSSTDRRSQRNHQGHYSLQAILTFLPMVFDHSP